MILFFGILFAYNGLHETYIENIVVWKHHFILERWMGKLRIVLGQNHYLKIYDFLMDMMRILVSKLYDQIEENKRSLNKMYTIKHKLCNITI